jgi:TolA-binding protein
MKKVIAWCCLVVLVAGCAKGVSSRRARYPNPVTSEARASFDAAEALYLDRRFREADVAFATFISEFPYTELTDKARFRRGEIAFAKGNYPLAISFYRQSYSEISSPSVAPKSRFKAALALYNLRRCGESLSELEGIIREEASAVLRLRIDSLGVLDSKCVGGPANAAILWNLYLLDDYAEGAGARASEISPKELVAEEAARAEVVRWIEDQTVTVEEVQALPLKQMKGKRSGGYAAYKLAYILHTSGEATKATRHLNNYLKTYPKHEYYGAARLLAAELGGEFGEGAGISVGAILPLSGRYSVYGESVLHGIECAIGVYKPCVGPAGVRVVVRDSASSAVAATQAVDELVREGVVAIVGPLLSATVMEAAERAQRLGVPMISLSQREEVVTVGHYIFRNSVSTASEVYALVDHAMRHKGLKNFFILYPDNRKGAEYERLFAQRVEAFGGTVVASRAYAPNQLEFVSELKGSGGREGIIDATGGRLSYDAIFIPDSFRAVGYIAPTLALMGVRNVQLLGISRWDDPGLIERGGKFVEGAIFVDSFYRQAPDAAVTSFVSDSTRPMN